MIALETLLGEDTTIGVEELLNSKYSLLIQLHIFLVHFLSDPEDNPVMVNGRAMMEKKLKLI